MDLEKVFNYFIKVLVIVFLGIIIISNILNENLVSKMSNIGIIIISLIFILIYVLLKKQIMAKKKIDNDISRKKYIIFVILIFLLSIIFQRVLVKNFYFTTGWDVSNIYYFGKNYVETKSLNELGKNGTYVYLSTYPNNLFLCRLYVFTAMHTRGLNLYKVLLFLNRLIINLTAIILLRIFTNYKIKRKFKILGLIVYELLIGISPWTLIPYSDTFGILFPAIALLNYSKEKKKWFNYVFIGIAATIGVLLKPTTIIICIAIAILEIIKFLGRIIKKECNKEVMKTIFITCFMVLLGVAIGKVVDISLQKKYPYEINKNHSMTIYHYLMMGLNEETNGGFNLDDFWNTFEHYGVDEKKNYNIAEWKKRLKKVNIGFLSKKVSYSYNDGTFAWEGEGEFYNSDFEYENQKIFDAFSSFYKKEGSTYFIFSFIYQFIWMSLLIICLIGAIITKAESSKAVLYLSFIGQTLFLLLFEARARYLIIYLPIFITIATISMQNIKLPQKVEIGEKNNV